ncbi:conserved hypothetical protein [Carnobacterium sp. 17-4]|uniref:Cof-type HAD-IIB family hydrolase n=1 Tax=Carnobacterium sp. (strain 17-4) TaxID=208596 RepID=UPI0002058AB9|nr:Cof-type HAD-IIB family hydrolase [Carnobacterium sp. 17-4]AEB28923.1 conserved hypothetical protein [Carnobacterium sp. 17-4]
MYKLIFFDIDGTLLTDKKRIPDSARKAIQNLKSKGIIPVIATGRAPFRIDEILASLDIQTHITLNGQYVVHEGEVIHQNPLSVDSVKRLALAAETNKQRIAFCGSDEILGTSMVTFGQKGLLKKMIQQVPIAPPKKVMQLLMRYIGSSKRVKPVLPHYYEDRIIYQCIIHTTEEYDTFYQEAFPDCHFTRWNPYSVDVISKGMSKAVGIRKLIEHIGIDISETVAFGDGLNDIEMLQAVGMGIAMENGRTELKEIADDITSSPENHGILKGLQKLNLVP